MRAVLIGAVESTRVAMECLAAAPQTTLAGLVTLPAALSARHSDYVDLRTEACAIGCPVIEAANGNADDVLEMIAALQPDTLFVIGWSQLCGEKLRALTPGRVIGYHPAPLPRLRGRGVIPWTILLDEPITAGTLFFIDEGTDSGAIIAQRFFHVAPDEYAATLYRRHMNVLAEMLPEALLRLAQGEFGGAVQDTRFATWAARRRPEDARIRWEDASRDIWRLIRACGAPYPGAHSTLKGEPIVLIHADTVPIERHRAALLGQIVARDTISFTVRCGDGYGLRVDEWHWSRPGLPPLHATLGDGA